MVSFGSEHFVHSPCPICLEILQARCPVSLAVPRKCSPPLLHAPCDREVIPSRASLLLLTGAPTLRKVSSDSLWLFYEGPGITASFLILWGQTGQHVGKTLSPQILQVMSRPCHGLAVSQSGCVPGCSFVSSFGKHLLSPYLRPYVHCPVLWVPAKWALLP